MTTDADPRFLFRRAATSFRDEGKAERKSWGAWIAKILGASLAVSLTVALGQGGSALAGSATATMQQPPHADPEARRREEWRVSIRRTPLPGNGCFTATYPATNW
jgi:hypothetical protein